MELRFHPVLQNVVKIIWLLYSVITCFCDLLNLVYPVYQYTTLLCDFYAQLFMKKNLQTL